MTTVQTTGIDTAKRVFFQRGEGESLLANRLLLAGGGRPPSGPTRSARLVEEPLVALAVR